MTYILGLNTYHADSSACLIRDGQIVAAIEEERLRRVKHWAGFPSQAIQACLDIGGINLTDVDTVAVNRDPKANLFKKVGYVLRNRPSPGMVWERIKNGRRVSGGLATQFLEAFGVEPPGGSVVQVEHHMAHVSSAFHVCPYDEAVVVSVDGFGDFASATWGVGRNNEIRLDGRIYFPHSLGMFYQALTQYLGFPHYGDEYKIMGLAPYGEPKFMEQMRQIVQLKSDGKFALNPDFFVYQSQSIAYKWENCAPSVGRLYSDSLIDLLGPTRDGSEELAQRHKDIARSVQAMYEEAFFHMLNACYERYRIPALAIAGGCAMNSVANGKIRLKTPFKDVYIQSAAGDAGGALGAALSTWYARNVDATRFDMRHAYLGPEYSDAVIKELLDARSADLAEVECSPQLVEDENELCRKTAEAVAQGKVIGWFQGRLEWGPRALGNRSIVCDPRRSDMKEILNLKIKRRESFRPFAPSVLREHVDEWFEQDDDVPFMMKVLQIRPEKREQIPAVTHADGSGRLQTVYRDTNPRYSRLIESFREATGVPMVLNTSFNENEPVVCKPEEALDCFLRTNMDVLVLGSYFIQRKDDENSS